VSLTALIWGVLILQGQISLFVQPVLKVRWFGSSNEIGRIMVQNHTENNFLLLEVY
jgi:hypothetical protein